MKFKKILSIFLIAVISNLLTAFIYSSGGEHKDAMTFVFVEMPLIWIPTILLTIIISIIQRKKLFTRDIALWTILLLIFCTPIPAFLLLS